MAADATIVLVVARARNGVIGANGALPWRLKSDMAHFRATTMGKPVVMGRKTWDSLKGPLKGRDNIVVTRNAAFRAEGAWSCASVDAALAFAQARAASRGASEVCIIGGADLYAATLPVADRICVTEVDAEVAGDAHFPPLDPAHWRETAVRDIPAGEGDDHSRRVRTLTRAP
jgi:dihydrofolate reductase